MTTHEDAQAAHINENWQTALDFLDLLGDRRVLTDDYLREDVGLCVRSVAEMRGTLAIMQRGTTPGALKECLRSMQAACRDFLTAAGTDGRAFRADRVPFNVSLNALRRLAAREASTIIHLFGMPAPSELKPLLGLVGREMKP